MRTMVARCGSMSIALKLPPRTRSMPNAGFAVNRTTHSSSSSVRRSVPTSKNTPPLLERRNVVCDLGSRGTVPKKKTKSRPPQICTPPFIPRNFFFWKGDIEARNASLYKERVCFVGRPNFCSSRRYRIHAQTKKKKWTVETDPCGCRRSANLLRRAEAS